MDRDYSRIAKVLAKQDRFVVVAHERPDGDALGSMMAMYYGLSSQSKKVSVYSKDEIPSYLKFLPGLEQITQDLSDQIKNKFALIVLDCHEDGRIGPEGKTFFDAAEDIIILDHHLGDSPCSKLSKDCHAIIDSTACSTAQLVFELFKYVGINVDKTIATCLYTGIMSDTGGFKYSNTNSYTFELARELVEAGADPYSIALSFFESQNLAKLRLLGKALDSLEIYHDGLLSLMCITPEMYEATGAKENDTDDFVSFARSIDSVEVAAIVKQPSIDKISVSLRSKRYVNVAEIAGRFGGGGHFNAAGFRTNESLSTVKEKLIEIVGEYLRTSKNGKRHINC